MPKTKKPKRPFGTPPSKRDVFLVTCFVPPKKALTKASIEKALKLWSDTLRQQMLASIEKSEESKHDPLEAGCEYPVSAGTYPGGGGDRTPCAYRTHTYRSGGMICTVNQELYCADDDCTSGNCAWYTVPLSEFCVAG